MVKSLERKANAEVAEWKEEISKPQNSRRYFKEDFIFGQKY